MHECAAIYANGVLGVTTEPHKVQQSLLFKVASFLSRSTYRKATMLKRKARKAENPLSNSSLRASRVYLEHKPVSTRRGYGF